MIAKCTKCKKEIKFSTKKRQCDECIRHTTKLNVQKFNEDPFQKIIRTVTATKYHPERFYKGGSYIL